MMRSLKNAFSQRNALRLLWHYAKAFLAALRYSFPARHLRIIGITGTDGKTTTVGMTAHILEHGGIPAGALSTAFFRIRGSTRWNETQKTSPSPFVIQRFLRSLVRQKCTHAVVEFSSHGLVQSRTHFTWPIVAGITNTAMEHLDYHGTMPQYRKDKGILFGMLRGKGTKVLNFDDETFDMYRKIPSDLSLIYFAKSPIGDVWCEGEKTIVLWLEDKTVSPDGSRAKLCIREGNIQSCMLPLHLTIPGSFNLDNALCAIACAHAVGIPVDAAVKALETFHGIPGRMEAIDEGQDFKVYIDFTVTPQAFEKTLASLREMIEPGKRILVLTGSCGDRMREKRPLVGRICSELADVVVLTDDEPYTEDPLEIIEEIWEGIDTSTTAAHKIPDRMEAIAFILREAKPGDAVLLCGLGSYPSRMMADGPIPWNEQEIARTLLKTA